MTEPPTTATISGLSPRRGYRFRVAAQNAAGVGPSSELSEEVWPEDWLSIEEVKDQLRIEGGDAIDDRLIRACRDAATEHVQQRCGRVWGDDVPPDVRRAAAMIAARLVKRRDSLDGNLGIPDVGVVHVYGRDWDTERLLVPYLAIPVA